MNQLTTKQDLFTLAPKNLTEAMEYANLIANSEMVPKNFQGRPADVLVAVQMGAELGLPPTQALQNIAVINGRPSVWGDAVIAIVQASPLCEYVRETWDDATKTATCITKRRGDDMEVERTFSFEDAKRAELITKKGPWTQYPKRMAQMRARSFTLRDAYPDLLRGIHVAEEAMDIVEKDITPAPASTEQKPQGKKRSEQLANKLKQRDEQVIDHNLSSVLDQINAAESKEALSQVAHLAAELSQEQQIEARSAYKARLAVLNEQEVIE